MSKEHFQTGKSGQRNKQQIKHPNLMVMERATKILENGEVGFKDVSFRIKANERWIVFSKESEIANVFVDCVSCRQPLDSGTVKTLGHISWLVGYPNGISNRLSPAENGWFLAGIVGQRNSRKKDLETIQRLTKLTSRQWNQPLGELGELQKKKFKLAISIAFDFELYIIKQSLFRPLIRAGHWDEDWKKTIISKLGKRSIITVGEDTLGISSLCNRGIVLENGKIVAMGKPDECRCYLKGSNAA